MAAAERCGQAMLLELRIRNFAIIEQMGLEFGPGLNVLSGEAGAGKTIIMNALGLLLGMRASPEMVRAVASHADFLGVSRETPMEKTLYAVDELSGFILAVAYVRPEGLVGMTPKSVKKKMKQPSFAAAVGREELIAGAEALGVDFDEHVEIVIGALADRSDELLPAA